MKIIIICRNKKTGNLYCYIKREYTFRAPEFTCEVDDESPLYWPSLRDAILDAQATGKLRGPVGRELYNARQRERRKAREQAMRDLGLVKVRGSIGGTYWE